MLRGGIHRLRSRLEHSYRRKRGYGSGRDFVQKLVASVVAGDTLLDAGCGEGKLRDYLPAGVHYVGLDRYIGKQESEYSEWMMRPSVVGDIHQLPLESDAFDTVALMHVLEHAKNPVMVLAEVFRVLKPGGFLFMDVPFLHEIHHGPNDYYRYTRYALMSLATSAGLELVDISPSGGYFRALAHLLEEAPTVVGDSTASGTITRISVAYPLKGLGWILRKLEYALDLQDSTQTFTRGYHCIFRKPTDAVS